MANKLSAAAAVCFSPTVAQCICIFYLAGLQRCTTARRGTETETHGQLSDLIISRFGFKRANLER